MSNKKMKRVNGGLAIFYGIGCAISAAMGLVALGMDLFQVFFSGREFSWGFFSGVGFITLLMAGLAYAILRTGYEEIES